MRLNEGRIGRQESVSMLGLALFVSAVFTVNSKDAYGSGNSTYVWLPASVALAFLIFWTAAYAMDKCSIQHTGELFSHAFGKVLGSIFTYILVASLLFSAYLPLSCFAEMIHNFIFIDSSYIAVTMWMIPVVALLSFWGLECIGRVSKCFAAFLAILLLASFAAPAASFESYRLYPLMGDGINSTISHAVKTVFKLLPALMAVLGMINGVQGAVNARKYGIIAAAIALFMCAVTQLTLSLTYTYCDLADMYAPMYRLNMSLLFESYFFRVDKISLFLWLISGLITAAFYIYAAAILICRQGKGRDTRPVTLSATTIVFSIILLESSGWYTLINGAAAWLEEYGYLIIAPPILFASGIVLLRERTRAKEGSNEKAA
ncbi:MAG: GerAB/ArcD/ProY family transporter [Clostridia bacterium]